MSDKKEIVIIGPSKVGKTALVASLYHAAVTFNQQNSSNIEVIAKNGDTRDLFTKVNQLLQTGTLPFAGSHSIINYHIQMTTPVPTPKFLQKLKITLGLAQEEEGENCEIHFPDAPGGAIFHGDDDEADEFTIKDLRQQLIRKISSAFGLIICLDASILSPTIDTNDQKRAALNFAKWLPGLLAEVIEKQQTTVTGRLNIKRVCIVMTKADLWAKNNNYTDLAETTVHNRDSYDHAIDILGKAFFTGFRQFFDKNTEFNFFMSSVFGFYQGGLQERFFAEEDEETVLSLDEWMPFNVIEPFLTAVDAKPPNCFVTTKQKIELGV